jgi:hypothetical protein
VRDSERLRLLGSYAAPRVRVGDRAVCLYRDCDVVITSVSNAPIPWPRCRFIEHSGGSGLLVDETLRRAIETESADALEYWFGVTHNTVWKWRRAFGVGSRGTEGSRRLYRATADELARKLRGKALSPKVKRKMRRRAIDRNAARRLRAWAAANRRPWGDPDVALLGTMPDAQVGRHVGRSRFEVASERRRRGIPLYRKPKHPEAHLSAGEREALRRERMAAAKRGKPRPAHVIKAMRKGRTGKPHSPEVREKMRQAQLARRERVRAGRA